MTCNQFGQGRVYYAATQLAPEGLDKLLDEAAQAAKVSPVAAPLSGLEIVRRQGGKRSSLLSLSRRSVR